MTVWLDNQLPPALAGWMRTAFGIECTPVRDIDLQRASDLAIFQAARVAQAVVMSKDHDFADLVRQHGTPPQVILVVCGNTSNERLQQLLERSWPTILLMLDRGEMLVELGASPEPKA